MKILFAASEAWPFAGTGGLADVAGALPKALRERLVGCRVVMPLYECVPQELRENMTLIATLTVPVAWRRQYCGVFEAHVGGVIYYLLDNQYYFKREGLYGHFDDAERFAFFSRAVLEMIGHIDYLPDIIHSNDWQCALIPVYHKLFYKDQPEFAKIRHVFTIHNIQYQGKYGMEILGDVFGIPNKNKSLVEQDRYINLMKGGIEAADLVTTVSPTYAQEIMDPWFAHGLDGILRMRSGKVRGILNGIDTVSYNPATDKELFASFSTEDMTGKAVNKKELQKRLGLAEKPEAPLVAMVSRLVAHKGMDLVQYALDEFLQGDVQVAVLGSGEWVYEQFFGEMKRKYPDKCAFVGGFIPELARKLYAGADIFLMPSKSEPCGLSQMVACRYGTVPVVRETGGLKDSIADVGDGGMGFTFKTYNAGDMLGALRRATGAYADKAEWPVLVGRAMRTDFSWGRSANEYKKLYRGLIGTVA